MNTWFVRVPNAKDPVHTPPGILLVTAENVEMATACGKRMLQRLFSYVDFGQEVD